MKQHETLSKMGLTPLYLRDLTEDLQQDWISRFSTALNVAYKDGQDIIIGYYIKNPKVEE